MKEWWRYKLGWGPYRMIFFLVSCFSLTMYGYLGILLSKMSWKTVHIAAVNGRKKKNQPPRFGLNLECLQHLSPPLWQRVCFVSVGTRGSVLPGAVSVSHGAGEGGGDGGRHQERHPPGQAHLLLHLLLTRWGGFGGGNEKVNTWFAKLLCSK